VNIGVGAVLEDLLAEKGGNGLDVVLQTGGRIVRCTDAVEFKGGLELVSINHQAGNRSPRGKDEPTTLHLLWDALLAQRVLHESN
jgi:hypothetical protein